MKEGVFRLWKHSKEAGRLLLKDVVDFMPLLGKWTGGPPKSATSTLVSIQGHWLRTNFGPIKKKTNHPADCGHGGGITSCAIVSRYLLL